jgi:hypothetical protein
VNSPILLVALVCGALLPIPALILRRLDLRRDLLFLIYYAQAFLYVQFGPWDYLRRTPSAAVLRGDYEALAVLSVILFNGIFLAAYLVARGRGETQTEERRLQVSSRTFTLLNAALLAFAIAFWVIAITHELVFRRLGNTIIPKQLTLSLRDFVVYRSYSEGIWLLSSVVFAGLVVGGRRISVWGRVLAVANLASAYLYLVINTRIGLGLALALLVGLWALLWRGAGAYLPRLLAVGGAAALVLLYSTSTTERIRVGFGRTNTITWRAFLPGLSLEEKQAAAKIPGVRRKPRPETAARPAGPEGEAEEIGGTASNIGEAVSGMLLYRAAVETPLSLRLNGLDLMARMRPSLQTDGYAWGRAWKDPVALVYLPIVDPARARRMKMHFDIAAKNYLMRRYTDLDQSDYFSCMLSDAYGNFGALGIALVGLVLGVALGLSVRGLRGPVNALVAVIALFAISHLFQFEQEFVSATILWTKKLPFLAAVLVVNPFRTGRDAPPNPRP